MSLVIVVVQFCGHYLSADIPRWRLVSPVVAYSVCYYVVTTIATFLIFCRVAVDLYFRQNDFLSATILTSLVLATLMCLYTPLLCWMDIKRTVLYLEDWIQFQVKIFASSFILHVMAAFVV
jgi:hypothetical protein